MSLTCSLCSLIRRLVCFAQRGKAYQMITNQFIAGNASENALVVRSTVSQTFPSLRRIAPSLVLRLSSNPSYSCARQVCLKKMTVHLSLAKNDRSQYG